MKKSVTLSIVEPCHEDWSAMTSTQKGKFCDACTKEVVNFTTASDEDIVAYVLKNKNACGRFLPSQLGRELTLERKSKYQLAPFAASLLVPFAMFATTNKKPSVPQKQQKEFTSLGIGSIHKNRQLVQKRAVILDTIKTVTISGTITDVNGLPLPGVKVIENGNTKSTQTDFEGVYTIKTLPGKKVAFSLSGYETKEILASTISNTIDIQLHENLEIMGEMMIMGGIRFNPKTDKDTSISPQKNSHRK